MIHVNVKHTYKLPFVCALGCKVEVQLDVSPSKLIRYDDITPMMPRNNETTLALSRIAR